MDNMDNQHEPRPESIGEMYDKIAVLSEKMLGDNHHFGFFTDDADGDVTMQEAADRMTDALIRRLSLSPGQRVLDLGCGTGRPALRIAEAVQVEVIGITISSAQLEIAKERAIAAHVADRVQFQLIDATSMPFPGDSFDAVLAIESLEHLPDQAGALRSIANVLRPGGRLVGAQPVLQKVDDDERDTTVRDLYQMYNLGKQPFFDEYPQMFSRAGLRTLYLEDVYEHVIPPTMRVVGSWIQANTAMLASLGDYAKEVVDLVDGMRTFASLPGVGYAMFAADKV